ncbi:hypothetical protein LXL04_028417 [Taraxacum kok-saghyz]
MFDVEGVANGLESIQTRLDLAVNGVRKADLKLVNTELAAEDLEVPVISEREREKTEEDSKFTECPCPFPLTICGRDVLRTHIFPRTPKPLIFSKNRLRGLKSAQIQNSCCPGNPRTPKPLTFSKNRLREAKNAQIQPVLFLCIHADFQSSEVYFLKRVTVWEIYDCAKKRRSSRINFWRGQDETLYMKLLLDYEEERQGKEQANKEWELVSKRKYTDNRNRTEPHSIIQSTRLAVHSNDSFGHVSKMIGSIRSRLEYHNWT